MKYKLPILTAGLISGLLAVCWWVEPLDFELLSLVAPTDDASNQLAIPTERVGGAIIEVAGDLDQPPHGQWLVGRAVQEIVNQRILQAEVRQQVDLYGHHLVGTGCYRQFFYGDQQRLRLEMKLQVGHEVSSLTQVADGRHFWTRLDMPRETTLSRIDLRRVREAVWRQTPGPLAQSSMWMALGGLPSLLQGLESHFEFSQPQAAQWQRKPVWVTEGTWKPALVKHHWGTYDSIPEHIPGRVQLVLGRDSKFPLFPYRVQFWWGREAVDQYATVNRPMVTVEFHRVTRPTYFSLGMFDYKRGDQVVIDRTDTFLKHLGKPPWSLVGRTSP